MSTHNICFCQEIRKISAFFGWKKHLICCYDQLFFLQLSVNEKAGVNFGMSVVWLEWGGNPQSPQPKSYLYQLSHSDWSVFKLPLLLKWSIKLNSKCVLTIKTSLLSCIFSIYGGKTKNTSSIHPYAYIWIREFVKEEYLIIHVILGYFFPVLHKNVCCGCSLEAPWWGPSYEYPQHTFFVEK